MIVCEKCGSDSSVLDSRPINGSIRRRRRCDACDHRWTTFEVSREMMLALRDIPTILMSINTGTQELHRLYGELHDVSMLLDGGQGPIKVKRQLRPRNNKEAA